MSTLELRHRNVGPWGMNTYALVCPATKASVLIDPGADPETLLAMLAGTTPVAILLTHTHQDHVGALAEMQQALKVPLLAHPNAIGRQITADRWLDTGDQVTVGESTLGVVYAPGHIDDQICFILENDHRIIVGDTIFAGGPGRTASTEAFQTTLATLRNVVLSWPDEALCYPGHGPSFRLGDIRAAVEGFVQRDHGPFFGDAEW